MSAPTIPSPSAAAVAVKNAQQQIKLLTSKDDKYDGVIVKMEEETMDPASFVSILKASISHWKQQELEDFVRASGPEIRCVFIDRVRKMAQTADYRGKFLSPSISIPLSAGKKGVWIELPIHLVNLVEPLVKEGFWYHHAEPKYIMLVYWIPDSPNTIPANASHQVGVGAFVMNEKREVLVVREKGGLHGRKETWKFVTGIVNQGEDICAAAVREVKEETGVDSKFLEVLAFRQSHNSAFGKSDLFFLCMLHPVSSDLQIDETEIEAAKWMPFEEYSAQPFVQKSELMKHMSEVCKAKANGHYSGFVPVPTKSRFDQHERYLYLNAGSLKRSNSL